MEKTTDNALQRKAKAKKYQSPHFVRLCMEEEDYQKFVALADKYCGGNVTLYFNRVLKQFLSENTAD